MFILRALYRTLELPGANPLRDAHAALDTVRTTVSLHHFADAAVLTAYGFSAKMDLLALWSRFGRLPQRLTTFYSTGRAQLLALNQQVVAKIEKGEPVMPPGVPKNHLDPKMLVTKDCIRPRAAP